MLTVEDYNEYCHYVAGLVGLGLTRLFHASGLESFQPDDLSNSMGLFLQVLTNLFTFIKRKCTNFRIFIVPAAFLE